VEGGSQCSRTTWRLNGEERRIASIACPYFLGLRILGASSCKLLLSDVSVGVALFIVFR